MRPAKVDPVKLVSSVISGDPALMEVALGKLESSFGRLDYLSPILPFDRTGYYEAEMGRDLSRRIVSFEELIEPGELADIKLRTNSVEDDFLSQGGKRRVNVDPGYLTLHNLVLASCKNFAHRVYIGRGVYAEVTLLYRKDCYRPLEWTYPDYRDETMRGIFKEIRARYARRLGRGGKGVQ